jgi:deoxycytidylate deaminase
MKECVRGIITMGLLGTVEKKKKWDNTFMQIAYQFAEHSSCVKRKVGAVLVKDLRVLSTGYNGTPIGFCNCNEVFKNIFHNYISNKNLTIIILKVWKNIHYFFIGFKK